MMKKRWVVLLLVVLGVGLFGAFMSEAGAISAEPQPPLQSPEIEIVPEVTGVPPPPPGCRMLVTSAEPTTGGTIDVHPEPNCGATWYILGENVTVMANPAPGYMFDSWLVVPPGSTITNPVLNLTLNSNYFVVANFVPEVPPPPPGCWLLQVTENPSTGGTIDVDPQPDCGGTWYQDGSVVTLTAVPGNNYTFLNWSGSVAGLPGVNITDPVISFAMNDNQTAIANFNAVICYQIQTLVNPVAAGLVDIQTPENCPGGWLPGTGILMEAVPSVGYTFGHWEVTDPNYAAYNGSTNNPLIIQNGDLVSDVTFTAYFNFTPNCYDIVTQISPPGEGFVTFNPPRGTDCPGGWINGNVTIQAIPNHPTAFQFDSWSGDINSVNNPETITINNANMNITANFTQIADETDLHIQQWDTMDPVMVGQKFMYVLLVGSNGPDLATNVQVTDVLPPSMVIQTETAFHSGLSCNIVANVITCDLSFLGPGQTLPIFIQAMPTAAGLFTNTATISTTMPTNVDTDLSNNTAEETTLVLDQPISGLSAENDGPTALGMTTMFSATVISGTNVVYAWDFGDGNSGSGANAGHVYGAEGVYTAVVTASNSANVITATTAVLIEEAVTGLAAENDGPTALGNATALSATISGGTAVSYAWDFGDGSGGSGITATHVYTAVGIYTATVTASNNVSVETAETIVIVEEAISGLSATNDSPTTLGLPTTLTATISTGTNVSYTWDFGDNSSGIGIMVTHIYTASGTFTATVTATNAVGSQVAVTTVVIEVPVYKLYLPAVAGKP